MSLRAILEEKAINRLAGFLTDDPQGVAEVPGAIDDLSDDPRPSSHPFRVAEPTTTDRTY